MIGLPIVVAVELPNPVDWIPNPVDAAGDAVADAGQVVLSAIGAALLDGLADAAASVSAELLDFVANSATIRFDAGWWAGERAQQVVGSVLLFSGALMVVFLLLALLQGLLRGEPVLMLRSALLEVPVSVFATVVLVSVTSLLLALTDAASAAVLSSAPVSLERFLGGFGVAANMTTAGLAGIIMVVVFLLGALFVWVELVVRSALLYLLVAFAPLTLAARVWPVTRGAFRKLCELGVALILSKFAIALALALGAAALGGGGPDTAEAGLGEATGLDLAGLLGGATLMLLAAFTPFVILRMIPVFEAAVVAQGISRSPARGAATAMQTAYYADGFRRLAGGGNPGMRSSAGSGGGPQNPGSSAPRPGSSPSGPASPGGGPAGPGGGPVASPGQPGAVRPPTPNGSAGGVGPGGSTETAASKSTVPVGVATAGATAAKRRIIFSPTSPAPSNRSET